MSASQRKQDAPPARAPAPASSAPASTPATKLNSAIPPRQNTTAPAGSGPSAQRQQARSSSSESAEDAAHERAREARRQEHWQATASAANTNPTYPVVFSSDMAPEVKAAVVRLLGGTAPQLSNVPRKASFLEAASNKTDIGTVPVAMVSAQHYEAIDENFKMYHIMVTINDKPRMAWVPLRQKARSSGASD